MVIRRKLVAVGDYCGKTYALETFIFDELPEPHVNYIEKHITDVEVDGNLVELHVFDTCDKERFKEWRTAVYKGTDVFLIFFSVFSTETLANAKNKWIREVRKYGPNNVPVLLVGTHCRSFGMCDNKIEREEIEAVVNKIGAIGYIECSAENKWNLDELFVKAVAATL